MKFMHFDNWGQVNKTPCFGTKVNITKFPKKPVTIIPKYITPSPNQNIKYDKSNNE